MPRFPTDNEKLAFIREHVRYRLVAVDGLAWVCEVFLGRQMSGKVAFTVNGQGTNYYHFTNALVDAGLGHGRALAEFAGIVLPKGQKALGEVRRIPKKQGDDVWPEDFGLVTLPISTATSWGPGTEAETRASLIYLLGTANKGLAHLTLTSAPADLELMLRGTQAVRNLVLKTMTASWIPHGEFEDAIHGLRNHDRMERFREAVAKPGPKVVRF